MEKENTDQKQSSQTQQTPTISRVLEDGSIIELLYDVERRRTSLCVWNDDRWFITGSHKTPGGEVLKPYSSTNNLIQNNVVLFPSNPEGYGTEQELIAVIQDFIHRYVDISPTFERIAAYYVLLTWLYDRFDDLPYFRVRGDYGSGKTRFLFAVGSLCYKPIFASGASSTASIFHMLHIFRGTFVIDEADFRFSDEKSDMVKILNNGNVNGMPLLRVETTAQREFNPRSYNIYGPKVVAMRGNYEDNALESRFITEEMGRRAMRSDISLKRPATLREEAQQLRNKLLMFRFRNFGKTISSDDVVHDNLEPRINQIFLPLYSMIRDEAARNEVRALAWQYHRDNINHRGLKTEALILEEIRDILEGEQSTNPTVQEITKRFVEKHGNDFQRPITARWMGHILRKRLGIKTERNRGVYIIPRIEEQELQMLYTKYGIKSRTSGDVR